MSAPPKPWERAGINNQNANIPMSGQMSSSPFPETVLPDPSRGAAPTSISRGPPPIPNRPAQQRSALGGYGSSYGGMGSSYGGYGNGYGSSYMGGSSMYGGYGGGYGGYGSSYGGYGMNRFGQNMDNGGYGTNSFANQAEESSRQAFQSIESIVQAVGSVSMMLESSFYAVYNSFRAVIGVADHFSRMKMAFAQIFSALAVVRTLRWLYRKLLVLLRLRPDGHAEEVWAKAAEEGAASLVESELKSQGRSSWPIMLFFGIIIGGPWLIWRLLSSITGKREGQEWHNGNDDHFCAVAEFDFDGEKDDELSFRRGQNIRVAPKELQPKMRGWLLASVDGTKQGIIPANYVKVLGKRRGKKNLPKPGSNPAPSLQSPPTNLALPSTSTAQSPMIRTQSLPTVQQHMPNTFHRAETQLEDSFHDAQRINFPMNPPGNPDFLGNENNWPEINESVSLANNGAASYVNDSITNNTNRGVADKTAEDILSKNEQIE